MLRLSAGCVIDSALAERVKEPVSATERKWRSCTKVMAWRGLFMHWNYGCG